MDRTEDFLREISQLKDSLSQMRQQLDKSKQENNKNQRILELYDQKFAEVQASIEQNNIQKK